MGLQDNNLQIENLKAFQFNYIIDENHTLGYNIIGEHQNKNISRELIGETTKPDNIIVKTYDIEENIDTLDLKELNYSYDWYITKRFNFELGLSYYFGDYTKTYNQYIEEVLLKQTVLSRDKALMDTTKEVYSISDVGYNVGFAYNFYLKEYKEHPTIVQLGVGYKVMNLNIGDIEDRLESINYLVGIKIPL